MSLVLFFITFGIMVVGFSLIFMTTFVLHKQYLYELEKDKGNNNLTLDSSKDNRLVSGTIYETSERDFLDQMETQKMILEFHKQMNRG